MKGTIKWFSQEKGHGYLIGEDGQEYHIHIKEIKGAILPRNGDEVEFEVGRNQKGLQARDVKIVGHKTTTISNNTRNNNNDERVVCEGCEKKMIPRLVFSNGRVTRSVCPFCATEYQNFSNCYIATAAYGSPYAPEVDTFRYFRDTVLVKSWFGRAFIAFYYKTSPPLADFIAEREYLKAATRKWLLSPLLYFLRKK